MVVVIVIIVIFLAVVFFFVFLFVWLLSKQDIGGYRLIRRAGIGAIWMYSAHT